MGKWSKAYKNFRTWKSMQAKEGLLFLEKNLIVMTKFPDISLTLVKCPKFPDIFSKFPDNSLTWRKFCFSLTFPWHVATLRYVCSVKLVPSIQRTLTHCGRNFNRTRNNSKMTSLFPLISNLKCWLNTRWFCCWLSKIPFQVNTFAMHLSASILTGIDGY